MAGDKVADANRTLNPHIPEGDTGLNLRDADNKIAGFAPRGTKLKLGTKGKHKGYYAVTEVVSGAVMPVGLTGAYAYRKELTETAADPTIDQVVVLDTPVAVKAGDLMGHLGQYQRYVDTNPLGSTCSDRLLVQLDVFSGDDVEGFIAKSRDRAKQLDDKQKTLLFIEAGAKLSLPANADQKVTKSDGIAPHPTSPKTGDWAKVRKGALQVVAKSTLSGYSSSTRTYSNGSTLSRILDANGTAIEIDAYNALTDKSAYTQREVMVPSGEPIWVQRSMLDASPLITGRSMDAWSQFPLQASDTSGPKAADPRVLAVKNLEKTATASDGTRWWQVTVGTKEGSARAGWAREKGQAKVRLCTPWDWPGFELVEVDSTTPATFYANHVAKQPQTPEQEQSQLQAQGASAEGAPLFDKLYDLIDLDDDRKLTPDEIRKALKQPWLAQAISRLITRYDSEWAGPMDKWNAIDPLIPETRKEDWTQEKKRIETLLWWDDLKGKSGFPTNTKAFNFHPIALVSNFFGAERDLSDLIRKIGDIISHGEGNYESYNSGTKSVKGGGVGHSYIRPAASTVTGKTINQILATDSLSGTDANRMFATGKYQTIIATLRSAKASMKLTGDEIYDAAMQERVFAEYLIDKAGGGALARFFKNGQGTIADAQYATAKEWASIAAPNGKSIKDGRISDGTLSYYESSANSANSVSTDNLRIILQQVEASR